MEPRKYQFNNSTLTIVFGDILTSKAEVIVSSDDTGISMGGGISGCIRKTGGESIREDAQKKLPAQLGQSKYGILQQALLLRNGRPTIEAYILRYSVLMDRMSFLLHGRITQKYGTLQQAVLFMN